MSTSLAPQVLPEKPWRPTFKRVLPDLFGALLTAVSTVLIVAVTPLKGKLGFSLTLIVMALVFSVLISGIRKDKKAAFNSVSTVFVYIAATFVLIPLFSILYEIYSRGVGALTWGIFTKDMSLSSADAPVSEGGLLHAIIGTLYLVAIATIISAPIGLLTALYIVEVKGTPGKQQRIFYIEREAMYREIFEERDHRIYFCYGELTEAHKLGALITCPRSAKATPAAEPEPPSPPSRIKPLDLSTQLLEQLTTPYSVEKPTPVKKLAEFANISRTELAKQFTGFSPGAPAPREKPFPAAFPNSYTSMLASQFTAFSKTTERGK